MSVVSEAARVAPTPALRALLREAIDYAGLFPPSEVALRDAVANYAAYRAEPDGWMLGKLVVPVGRLEEVAPVVQSGTSNIEHPTSNIEGGGKETKDQRPETKQAALPEGGCADAAAPATVNAARAPLAHARSHGGTSTVNGEPRTVNAAEAPWQISAVLGADALKEVEAVRVFNARGSAELRVTAVEARVASGAEAVRLAAVVPPEVALWLEFTAMPAEIPGELAAPNRGAKIRTGGVTAASFPAAADVAAFMLACRRAGVRFKATAGLHHPVTGVYPLTYAAGSERARMFGFLNVLLAAACVWTGHGDVRSPIISPEAAEEAETRRGLPSVEELVAMLECTDRAAFALTADGVAWRDRVFSVEDLRGGRAFMASFGSCSFLEPVGGLRELRWL